VRNNILAFFYVERRKSMDLIASEINHGINIIELSKENERQQKREQAAKENPPKEKKPVTFPPNMISKCSRQIVYHLLRLPVQLVIEPKLLRIFDNGDKTHERTLSYMAAAGILHSWEVKVEDKDNRIKGYLDAMIKLEERDYIEEFGTLEIPGAPYLIGEIKSACSKECYWIERKNAPSKKYVQQLQLYMHATGIHKGVVIIENKDTQDLYTFYVDYDPAMVTELLSKVGQCLECADTKILPDREGTRKSNVCWLAEQKAPRCPFYDICWSETEGKDLIETLNEANQDEVNESRNLDEVAE
jgi:hypothetical protein